MTLMTVSNHDGQGKDYWSQPRWSAGKKTEVVLRLPRGESLEELSRALFRGESAATLVGDSGKRSFGRSASRALRRCAR